MIKKSFANSFLFALMCIILCDVFYDVCAATNSLVSLSWVADGQHYTGNQASCEYGVGQINNISHKDIPGHTFIGWKVTDWDEDPCGLLAQDLNLTSSTYGDLRIWDGRLQKSGAVTAATYGLSEPGDFGVTFDYGIVKGVTKCVAKQGKNSQRTWTNNSSEWKASDSEIMSASGEATDCWCKMTDYTSNNGIRCDVNSTSWVFFVHYDNNSMCIYDCADACVRGLADTDHSKYLRWAMFKTFGK